MDDRIDCLARRGRRMRRDGEYRKAALAYRELTSVAPEDTRWWVLLAAVQGALGRDDDATRSLRQAAYLFRRRGDSVRGETVRALLDRVSEGETVGTAPRHHGRGWRRGYLLRAS